MSTSTKDVNGNPSSKRKAGFMALGFLALISGWAIVQDSSYITILVWPWASIIGVLFGATVLEKKV